MEIKKASFDDIALIREIGTITYWATYPAILGDEQVQYMLDKFYSPDAIARQMEEGHAFWIGFAGGVPAAFTSFSQTYGAEPIWHLQKLYILPEMQGRGIGGKLLEMVADRCREAGAWRLQLNVNRYNKAKKFYEKLGFRVVREEDIPIGRGYFMNDFVMERDLKETVNNSR